MKSKIAGMALILFTNGAASEPPATDRVAVAADLLAQADLAAADPSNAGRKALAKVVTSLDRIGVRANPDEAEAAAALANWRSRAGTGDAPMRGRVLGPAFRRGWLDAGGGMKVDQLFLAGQAASVAVAGAPGQSINLAVEGPDAPPACAGAKRSCRWMPIFTQRYTITIRNAGKAGTRYYLVMD